MKKESSTITELLIKRERERALNNAGIYRKISTITAMVTDFWRAWLNNTRFGAFTPKQFFPNFLTDMDTSHTGTVSPSFLKNGRWIMQIFIEKFPRLRPWSRTFEGHGWIILVSVPSLRNSFSPIFWPIWIPVTPELLAPVFWKIV